MCDVVFAPVPRSSIGSHSGSQKSELSLPATSKAFNMDDMREGFREGGLVAQVFGKENMPKTLGKLATRLKLN